MDYQGIEEREGGIILKNVRNFHPRHIFECGQCFRWNRIDPFNDLRYQGVVHGKVIEAELVGDDVYLHGIDTDDFNGFFRRYFDLKRDYARVKKTLERDPLLKAAIKTGHGIRVLNQEPFETLISFILSSNNLIPKIKEGIRRISMTYGEKIIYKGEDFYAFPTPEALSAATEEDLRGLGLGYRARYIADTAKKVRQAEILKEEAGKRTLSLEEEILFQYDLNVITVMPHDQCHLALQRYAGVGAKVADCVMLFSMEKNEAFPVDVWVKKAMVRFYGAEEGNLKKIRAFGQAQFGDLSGIAQQYLFYHARENKISID